MFCPNCAQPVKDGARFCEYCGFPLAGIQVPVQAPVAAPVEPAAVAEPEPVVVPEPEPVAVESEPVVVPEPEPVVVPEPEPVVAAEPEPVAVPAPEPVVAAPAPEPVYQAPVQAQPVAPVYQQPVQPQPTYAYQQPQPVYQQAAPQPATYVQAPDYAQAGVVAQAEKKPFTKSVWFKVLIGLVAAIALFAIAKTVMQGMNIANSGGILDSKGNPTAYALLNKDGSEITEALEKANWTFDDSLIWTSEDGNNGFYVCGIGDHEYTDSEIRGLPANAGSDEAVFTVLVDDDKYESLEDVVDKLIGDKVTVVDKEADDEYIFLILETESGERDFALVSHDDYSLLYRLDIANASAISSGYVQDFFGLYGTSLDDIWYDATGRSIAEEG